MKLQGKTKKDRNKTQRHTGLQRETFCDTMSGVAKTSSRASTIAPPSVHKSDKISIDPAAAA